MQARHDKNCRLSARVDAAHSGGSNRPRSANQSATFVFSAETSKIVRMFADSLPPKGTGETAIQAFAADSCSILSVENRAGAPSHRRLPKKGLRQDIGLSARKSAQPFRANDMGKGEVITRFMHR